jgi:L-lysine exporter family protein LysE/ArgO
VAFAELVKGILFGLGAAAPIGPVNVEIARRSIRFGVAGGFFLGCGAVTIDVLYCVLASLGVRLFAGHPGVLRGVMLVGAGFLAYLGIEALRSARKQTLTHVLAEEVPSTAPGPVGHYLTGLAMTAVNPMTLLFWTLATPTIAQARGWAEIIPRSSGVAVGALGWVVFFASLMRFAGALSRRKTEFFADIAGGLMLLGFAGYAIWRVMAAPL